MVQSSFSGFSLETANFFEQLKKNNNKEWFLEHRHIYDQEVLERSKDFIVAMGEKLRKLRPEINAIPSVNKSIFRLYRDVRFSKNKLPYKTHMGLWFWEGDGKRMEHPGFYFHLDPPSLAFAGGMHHFPKAHLAAYRDMAVHKKWGPKLAQAVREIEKAGFKAGIPHFKRVPRGYDPEHPNAELLKFKGLTAWSEGEIPESFTTARIVEYAFKRYQKMLPMHMWLLELCKQAADY